MHAFRGLVSLGICRDSGAAIASWPDAIRSLACVSIPTDTQARDPHRRCPKAKSRCGCGSALSRAAEPEEASTSLASLCSLTASPSLSAPTAPAGTANHQCPRPRRLSRICRIGRESIAPAFADVFLNLKRGLSHSRPCRTSPFVRPVSPLRSKRLVQLP